MGKLEDRMEYSWSFVFLLLCSDTIYILNSQLKSGLGNPQNVQSQGWQSPYCAGLRGLFALNSYYIPPLTVISEEPTCFKILGRIIKLNTLTMHVMEHSRAARLFAINLAKEQT